jgi:WD40 repeat protein
VCYSDGVVVISASRERADGTLALPDHANDLAWSPDGGRLAVACADGTVGLVQISRGGSDAGRLQIVDRHERGALSVAFSPDGRTLASGGEDGVVTLIDALGGGESRLESGGAVHALAWSPAGQVLAAASGRTVRFWAADGTPAGLHDDRRTSICAMSWNESGALLTVACAEAIHLLKPKRKAALTRIPADFAGPILTCAESPNGAFLALGHYDGTATVIHLDTGKTIQYGGLGGKVRALSWTGDGRGLVVPADDRVAVFGFADDAPATDRARLLKRHSERVTAVASTPGGFLLTGDRAGAIHAWNVERQLRHTFAVTTAAPVEAIACAPGGGFAAVSGRGGLLTLVDLNRVGRERVELRTSSAGARRR